MQKTTIDWPGLTHTWNPVVGCKHGCSYCYARTLHNGRHRASLDGKLKNLPQYKKLFHAFQWFPNRLYGPGSKRKPAKIFVGSMCDLFGEWVPSGIIKAVIDVAEDCPRHEFMFLTKNPKRYRDFIFPKNCWLGTTVIKGNKLNDMINLTLGEVRGIRTFLSIEPLVGSFEDVDLMHYDLVIVGAMTGFMPVEPKGEWIKSIRHRNIHYKENIRRYL